MNFEQHLFISYAIIDNQALAPGATGWITRFHQTLQALLSTRIGRDATIWRDAKLGGNDVLNDEIIGRLKRSAIMVSVLTPRYSRSEWCTREAREFCQYAQETFGLTVGNKLRIAKVVKVPLEPQELESLPAPMKETRGYEFFADEGRGALEYDAAYGTRYAELYNQQVAILSCELAGMIRTLEANGTAGGATDNSVTDKKVGSELPAPGKPAVYLAECSSDRKPERMLLDGELKRLGYPVLPDKPLPLDEADYVAEVEGLLARCALSVHLVGQRYGLVPDGPSAKSVSMLQNELAVAHCNSSGLKRLIWLPEGTASEQPPQQAFIDALHQDAHAQYGADLITGDVEQLKTAIHATLKKIEQPEPPRRESDGPGARDVAGNNQKLVYVICDEKDRKATVPVRRLCEQLGFEVVRPLFEGDAAQVRQANQQSLADCDAVLLFYGAGDEAWRRAICNELKKMAAYRQGKPLPAVFTYLAEPSTSDKEDLIDMKRPNLINGISGFAEAALAKSMQQVIAGGAPP
jgi:hypothetical protein